MQAPTILISAGEASGDLYAAALVDAIRTRYPEARFFGCAGPRMQEAGVEPVVDASQLAVVGLVEVIAHIPRIWREFQKLVRAATVRAPQLAIVTDSPDFHLRLAAKLKQRHIPVVYLVAPQVWAWRKGRIPAIRRLVDRLLCIFPFEEAFFREHRVPATYIGHPLTRLVRPSLTKAEFFQKHSLTADRPLVTLLPGSRQGEMMRHLPDLIDAVRRIGSVCPASFVLAVPAGTRARLDEAFFRERIDGSSIQWIEGETWDAIAHATLALAASGTVTVEAALLNTPMVTYYRVTGVSWLLGKWLVSVPFYSMVNLVAGRRVVPELMQGEMTGERLASEALRLLQDESARETMRAGLQEVAQKLGSTTDPMQRALAVVESYLGAPGHSTRAPELT